MQSNNNHFSKMPPHTRVWVYQSNRAFSEQEAQQLQAQIDAFTQQWATHGKELAACGEVLYQQFIVLAVDEQLQGASGCSIDSSVHFIKEIEQQYQVNLFDRLLTAYWNADQTQILTADRLAFQKLVAAGQITEATIVFNNLVQNKNELNTNWQIPVKNSWHKNMMPLVTK